MANAMWWVKFQVHLPSKFGGSGDTFTELISLSSPDLVDTVKASERAHVTARARLIKQLNRHYPSYADEFEIVTLSIQCVG